MKSLIQVDCCRSTTLLPVLYAGGAQCSIQWKVGYFCCLKTVLPFCWSVPALDCSFFSSLYCIYSTSFILFLRRLLFWSFCQKNTIFYYNSDCLFVSFTYLIVFKAAVARMKAWSRLSMSTIELSSLGVYAVLFFRILNRATVCCCRVHNGQSQEHKHISVY